MREAKDSWGEEEHATGDTEEQETGRNGGNAHRQWKEQSHRLWRIATMDTRHRKLGKRSKNNPHGERRGPFKGGTTRNQWKPVDWPWGVQEADNSVTGINGGDIVTQVPIY